MNREEAVARLAGIGPMSHYEVDAMLSAGSNRRGPPEGCHGFQRW